MPHDSAPTADLPSTDDLTFTVSSFCHQGGCVAVAALPDGGRAVRDTKAVDGPVLFFTADEWSAFLAGARDGEFD